MQVTGALVTRDANTADFHLVDGPFSPFNRPSSTPSTPPPSSTLADMTCQRAPVKLCFEDFLALIHCPRTPVCAPASPSSWSLSASTGASVTRTRQKRHHSKVLRMANGCKGTVGNSGGCSTVLSHASPPSPSSNALLSPWASHRSAGRARAEARRLRHQWTTHRGHVPHRADAAGNGDSSDASATRATLPGLFGAPLGRLSPSLSCIPSMTLSSSPSSSESSPVPVRLRHACPLRQRRHRRESMLHSPSSDADVPSPRVRHCTAAEATAEAEAAASGRSSSSDGTSSGYSSPGANRRRSPTTRFLVSFSPPPPGATRLSLLAHPPRSLFSRVDTRRPAAERVGSPLRVRSSDGSVNRNSASDDDSSTSANWTCLHAARPPLATATTHHHAAEVGGSQHNRVSSLRRHSGDDAGTTWSRRVRPRTFTVSSPENAHNTLFPPASRWQPVGLSSDTSPTSSRPLRATIPTVRTAPQTEAASSSARHDDHPILIQSLRLPQPPAAAPSPPPLSPLLPPPSPTSLDPLLAPRPSVGGARGSFFVIRGIGSPPPPRLRARGYLSPPPLSPPPPPRPSEPNALPFVVPPWLQNASRRDGSTWLARSNSAPLRFARLPSTDAGVAQPPNTQPLSTAQLATPIRGAFGQSWPGVTHAPSTLSAGSTSSPDGAFGSGRARDRVYQSENDSSQSSDESTSTSHSSVSSDGLRHGTHERVAAPLSAQGRVALAVARRRNVPHTHIRGTPPTSGSAVPSVLATHSLPLTPPISPLTAAARAEVRAQAAERVSVASVAPATVSTSETGVATSARADPTAPVPSYEWDSSNPTDSPRFAAHPLIAARPPAGDGLPTRPMGVMPVPSSATGTPSPPRPSSIGGFFSRLFRLRRSPPATTTPPTPSTPPAPREGVARPRPTPSRPNVIGLPRPTALPLAAMPASVPHASSLPPFPPTPTFVSLTLTPDPFLVLPLESLLPQLSDISRLLRTVEGTESPPQAPQSSPPQRPPTPALNSRAPSGPLSSSLTAPQPALPTVATPPELDRSPNPTGSGPSARNEGTPTAPRPNLTDAPRSRPPPILSGEPPMPPPLSSRRRILPIERMPTYTETVLPGPAARQTTGTGSAPEASTDRLGSLIARLIDGRRRTTSDIARSPAPENAAGRESTLSPRPTTSNATLGGLSTTNNVPAQGNSARRPMPRMIMVIRAAVPIGPLRRPQPPILPDFPAPLGFGSRVPQRPRPASLSNVRPFAGTGFTSLSPGLRANGGEDSDDDLLSLLERCWQNLDDDDDIDFDDDFRSVVQTAFGTLPEAPSERPRRGTRILPSFLMADSVLGVPNVSPPARNVLSWRSDDATVGDLGSIELVTEVSPTFFVDAVRPPDPAIDNCECSPDWEVNLWDLVAPVHVPPTADPVSIPQPSSPHPLRAASAACMPPNLARVRNAVFEWIRLPIMRNLFIAYSKSAGSRVMATRQRLLIVIVIALAVALLWKPKAARLRWRRRRRFHRHRHHIVFDDVI